jgi:hypothetical protein
MPSACPDNADAHSHAWLACLHAEIKDNALNLGTADGTYTYASYGVTVTADSAAVTRPSGLRVRSSRIVQVHPEFGCSSTTRRAVSEVGAAESSGRASTSECSNGLAEILINII